MPLKILVVDDAAFIRDMVKKQLRQSLPGAEILDAIDGRRAMSVLRKGPIDLVLSDWEMPEMSGEELLRWMRSDDQCAKTPFVMITSRGDRAHVVKAVEAGVNDYLGKPFKPDELMAKVYKQLKRAGKMPSAAEQKSAEKSRGVAFGSVEALTGGKASSRPKAQKASIAASNPLLAKAPSNSNKNGSGQGASKKSPAKKSATQKGKHEARANLRFPNGESPCVVRELSLQAMSGFMQRTEAIPALFDQAVADIEMEEGSLARVNGYFSVLEAGENNVNTRIIKFTVRFVDNDPDKFEVLSKYIARYFR
ncbi:response regulator [Marinibactrum halimedae]|uniref:Two-component system response regulator n=1 Tax=Marinibactrum halimedae TaxID=1444977 RepID=A0AA37T9Z0_9GAMM|nr:response regulator [Marinibactrum halimedae]MCD9459963.1 response regulator [Marinibactrum halimedae]GLS28269.1 two-component system response regulator [Marinibactrum halimedae]